MSEDTAQFYWCTRHQRVEVGVGCPANVRLGPYPTREAAEAYAETAARRNDAWDDEDERWRGDR